MTVCKSFYFFILFAVILVGCSKNTGKDKKSQVAATVNGVEITESQIDYLFKRSSQSRMSSSEILNLRRSILADIVRTELLAQKATKMNLDKSSDYKNGMFNASKEVLADLAIQKTINKIPNFNNEQLNSIVLNNPMVFEKRKLYVYEEIIIPTIDIKTIESIDKKI
ncbi:MAG: peptidyl-prolyl cis-trans isomerase, EpsD family, partial [Chlorobiaceae bacterium]|nr:peptidyl-prolyl cis-trans isomerase, EpsD family [Chlorobiaceae bacterium]